MSEESWNNLTVHQTPAIQQKVINIGDSLWYSVSYAYGEKGMVEYCIKSNTIKQIVQYPPSIKPHGHSICEHDNNIYIVDGYNGEIISFNITTKQFQQIIVIPKLGYGACCLAMNDAIYIFHGKTNCKYFVYSIQENKISTFTDLVTKSNMISVSILKYNDSIIRFGGYNCDKKKHVDTFLIGTPLKRNALKYEWTEHTNYKLPERMSRFGFVSYQNYIIIFGGGRTGNNFSDEIYLLDLNDKNNKWIKLNHIKCPLKSRYLAVLAMDSSNNNNIHLFTQFNNHQEPIKSALKHYSVGMPRICGEFQIINNINDKPDTPAPATATDPDPDQDTINYIMKSLQCETCDVLHEQLDNFERVANEYKEEIATLKKENIALKKELRKIKRLRNLSLKHYVKWSCDEVIDWIISLEAGRFEKYENKLRLIFKQVNANGSVIPDIDQKALQQFGITDFEDTINLHKHIQNLITEKNQKNRDDYDFDGDGGVDAVGMYCD